MNNPECKPMFILSDIKGLDLSHLGPPNAQENITSLSKSFRS